MGGIEEELKELKKRNDEVERTANELFAERRQREAEVEETERLIEAQRAANEAAENNLVGQRTTDPVLFPFVPENL